MVAWEKLPAECRACRWERGGPNCTCARGIAPAGDRIVDGLCIAVPVGLMLLFVLGLAVMS